MVHKKFNAKEIAFGGTFILMIVVIVTFYILFQAESVQLGYRIAEVTNKVAETKEEIKRLEAKKAALLSLKRVETIARESLGMTDPAPGQVFYEEHGFPEKKGS